MTTFTRLSSFPLGFRAERLLVVEGDSRAESDDRTRWPAVADEVLGGSGPVFAWLRVKGERGKATPLPPRPMAEQIARLRGALAPRA